MRDTLVRYTVFSVVHVIYVLVFDNNLTRRRLVTMFFLRVILIYVMSDNVLFYNILFKIPVFFYSYFVCDCTDFRIISYLYVFSFL